MAATPPEHILRPVRSFKPRRGRLGPTRADALVRLWPQLGYTVGAEGAGVWRARVPTTGTAAEGAGVWRARVPTIDAAASDDDRHGEPLDLAQWFGRRARTVLEVGSGMGETTAAMAAADPDTDVLAVEVHTSGLAALLCRVEALRLTNVRVADGDAVVLLRDLLAPDSLDEVRIYFPDPWPKARHAKRRLVGPAFLALVADRVRTGGRLHIATDVKAYAEHAAALIDASPEWTSDGLSARPGHRPVTRYEARGHAAGRASYDLIGLRRAPG